MNTQAAAQAPRHAAIELLARYTAAFKAAWQHRAELAGPARMANEAAFLPAALSLQETPVHPAPRRLAWGIMILIVVVLVWSIFGQVDIVAVAPGRIIVSERTKLIQPLEASVVRAELVRDGDRVKAGQVLIELDPTMALADKTSVQEQLNAANSEAVRTAALLQALRSGTAPAQNNKKLDAATQSQLLSEWQDISAKLAKLGAEANRREAEMATVKETITKLETTLPLSRQREADFVKLVDQGYISSHATQDKARERIELERDLATQRAKLTEAELALSESKQARASYLAETLRLLHDRNALAATKKHQLNADHSKASQRERQTQLSSPVDGVVQQLAIHSVGGVVTPAQALMIVVPHDLDRPKVSAEVVIANQDIGFVNAGQMAEVKLETFPYTRYGTVSTKVDMVTADAVTDEKKGSYYPALLTLAKRDMDIDGKRVPISPGMNITAEIKTGQRRIIEYLLSPVQRAGSESLRER